LGYIETQISNFLEILQILNGYLEPIAFLIRVSNWMPEKCGFEAIKRAIHRLEFTHMSCD